MIEFVLVWSLWPLWTGVARSTNNSPGCHPPSPRGPPSTWPAAYVHTLLLNPLCCNKGPSMFLAIQSLIAPFMTGAQRLQPLVDFNNQQSLLRRNLAHKTKLVFTELLLSLGKNRFGVSLRTSPPLGSGVCPAQSQSAN